METTPLQHLEPGTSIVVGGDRVTHVSEELAAAFRPGDALVPLPDSGDLLHVPAAERDAARRAVDAADAAFGLMGEVTDQQLDAFFTTFADRLADDEAFAPIAAANDADVEAARARGASTTRLVLDERMRTGMVEGLRGWCEVAPIRGQVLRTVEHDGWRLEQVADRLGVIAFVFEGRPNVFADACGVLRAGNAVVFRIGSAALATARAIVEHALEPALSAAGLPPGAVSLVDSPARSAGWALFGDTRVALAVARGSGEAVRQLGAVASGAGNPVSLHGTGGGWILAAEAADADTFSSAVYASLDRKVCNTLNTCVVVRSRAEKLVSVFLDALDRAAADRGVDAKLHVVEDREAFVPAERFERTVSIVRADGTHDEPQAELLDPGDLGVEWEWEESPEVTLVVVDDLDEAIERFNAHAPRLVVSVISDDAADHDQVWRTAHAPFVGNGFTRWVDGQYALGTPELGLSNWELGRLFGRSAVLSGDAIVTVRSRAVQSDPDLHR